MKYEVVQLEEKKVVGLQIRTSNDDPNMGNKIGMTWEKFFAEGLYAQIPHKKNDKTIGLYTHYEFGVKGEYDVVVCCEVEDTENLPEKFNLATIPSGSYAKFIVRGHVQKAVADFWTKFWTMDLDRKFSSDFEEYQGGEDMENAEIHIYISLNGDE